MMDKDEVKRWMYLHMLMGVKPVRSKYVMVATFSSVNAQKQFVDHLSEKVVDLVKENVRDIDMALTVQGNVLSSYKTENAALKEQVKDLKANIELFRTRGLPCAFCNATGSNQNDGKKCGHCDGTGIV